MLRLIAEQGVTIRQLRDVLMDLAGKSPRVEKASGNDLVSLIWLGKIVAPASPSAEALDHSSEEGQTSTEAL